jgi:REP element-mobilizing transposase RayT
MPGAAFHITARTQDREPWFSQFELEERVVAIIDECVTCSDGLLISRTVMPNHFHIVLRQGTRSLAWTMQPVMRRLALLLQRARDMKGHAFERRFRSKACGDSDHLRRSIAYTTINPVRAKICDKLCDYRWTSNAHYMDPCLVDDPDSPIMHGLRLFGRTDDCSVAELQAAFADYLEWRLNKDRCDEEGVEFNIPEPSFPAGDKYFARTFCGVGMPNRSHRKDLRDRAVLLLERIERSVRIDDLRIRYIPRHLYPVRGELIAALSQEHYRGCDIADYLRISDTTVSAVVSKMRYARLGGDPGGRNVVR